MASLSFANLVYFRAWAELFNASRSDAYWFEYAPIPARYLALMGNVLLLAAVFWVLLAGARRHRTGVMAKILLLGALVVLASLLNSARILIRPDADSVILRVIQHHTFLIGSALAIVLVAAFLIFGLRVGRVAMPVLIVASPGLFVTFGQAFWNIAHYSPRAFPNKPFASRLAGDPPRRVLWVVFDEWDQQLTFPERPSGLQLPELDDFRSNALYAPNVGAASQQTDISMPALTTGTLLDAVKPSGPNELLLNPAGSQAELPWSRLPHIFASARQMGFNTGIVGWGIPYCRILNESLTECSWYAGVVQYPRNASIFQIMPDQARSLFESHYRSPFGQSVAARRHLTVYQSMLDISRQMAANANLGFVLLHLPVPHPPYLYNRKTGRLDFGSTPLVSLLGPKQRGYVDALALVDRTWGELQRAVQAAGLWERTTILLTSDHPLRNRHTLDGKPSGNTVPFLLRFPAQQHGTTFHAPFNAVLAHGLLTGILSNKIATAEQAVVWLEQNRSRVPVRFTPRTSQAEAPGR